MTGPADGQRLHQLAVGLGIAEVVEVPSASHFSGWQDPDAERQAWEKIETRRLVLVGREPCGPARGGRVVSAFERYAVQRLLDKAAAIGVDVSGFGSLFHADGSFAAREWARLHPGEDRPPCCYDSVLDPDRCGCWVPVFEVEQAEPRPPTCPEDLVPRPAMCGDCAFRPGSSERADEWTAEALYTAAAEGTPFWCHDGMRRPARWEHPDGRVVEGSPDDWQPPIVRGVPYRADGSPGLLCAGWVAVAVRGCGS